MKFIDTLRENTRVSSVWLCRAKSTHLTKTGKEYESVTLQDKTGSVDGKIWDPGNPGIGDFDAPDYVAVDADVQLFNGSLQLNIRRIRKADESEYIPADYLPTSDKDNDVMFSELLEEIAGVKDPYLSRLLESFFLKDPAFVRKFRESSAAKSVHHGFMGGLLEHTLSVAKLCEYYCTAYPALNHDLLITAAICHDIGKTRELSAFPEKYRKALTICGTKSGRDCDKMALTGLTPVASEAVKPPTFAEANLVLECRTLYRQPMTEASFIDRAPFEKWYSSAADLHIVYIAEVLAVRRCR